MSDFELSKVPLEQFNITLSLEDEFLEARIASEIDSTDDIGQLKEAAKKLLTVAEARQAYQEVSASVFWSLKPLQMQNYSTDETS